jgi:signal transduction histidine kinase
MVTISTDRSHRNVSEASSKQVDALNQAAWAATSHDVTQAQALSSEAFRLATAASPPYLKGKADSLVNQAECDLLEGKYASAIDHVLCAHDIYRDIDVLDAWFLHGYCIMGMSYTRLGDYATSLSFNLKYLELAEALEDQEHQALALKNIGVIHSLEGKYRQAVDFYERALPLFERVGSKEGIGALYNNFSIEYRMLGDVETALDYALKGLSFFQEIHYLPGEARIRGNIGQLLTLSGEYEQAEYHLKTALRIAQHINNVVSHTGALLYLGDLYIKTGDFEEARACLLQALRIAEASQHKRNQSTCYEYLAMLYEQQGDYKQALEFCKQHHQLKDAILNEETLAKATNLEVIYKTRQALLEVETQKHLREEDRRYFERLTQMKDDILNTTSHDLKSPLTSLDLNLQLLRRHGRIDDERGQHLLSRLEATTRQMRSLITDLLELARLETGRSINIESCDLVQLIQDALAVHQPSAQQKNIRVQVHSPISSLMLRLDARRMSQALDNLISNAVKYTLAGGTVEVQIQLATNEVMVRVADTGIGIPPEALPHLFERFYRVQDKLHLAVEGTGLGLPIARTIIEQHGGKIRVESEVGVGSSFSFNLPLN